MRLGLSGDNFVRLVGGEIQSSVVTNAPSVRVEKIRRVANGPWHWHFRQPELCLFWFETPPQTLRATVDGHPATYAFSGGSQLCILPPRTEIEGEWKAGSRTSYTVAFLSTEFLEGRLTANIGQPVFSLEHPPLVRSLAEGWSLQALAYMTRIVQGGETRARRACGGLSNRNARVVTEYINAHLGEEMSLQHLAEQIGLSKRHFQRAFQETFGTTPYRYIIQQRIAQAKRELCQTRHSITDVALTNGFCQVEHFANVFKRFTGFTPSQFRERNT